MFFSKDDSEKEGKEVIKNLYCFSENQMFDCNQYLIEDPYTGELSLFDAGNAISLQGLFKGMEKLGLDYKKINKIFLSHEHADHILGVFKLIKILGDSPPEIFAYGETANILEEGDENKILPVMLGLTSRRFGIEIKPLQVNDLSDHKNVEISPEFNFQIHHTPGHSEGSICYFNPEKKVLISGDLVFVRGDIGRFDLPGGSLQKLKSSIEFINSLDIKYLLPGHLGISVNGNQEVERAFTIIKNFY
ncbi:hypothetical protein LCGC14_0802950 [marine sediment metagenome]|uniref:Metallo-beta-lactamase domain-containing protein n=1 Tax=marine sediment metagenome TaxID=412755 RepID=A0A0F9PNZ0_9ZZZZ